MIMITNKQVRLLSNSSYHRKEDVMKLLPQYEYVAKVRDVGYFMFTSKEDLESFNKKERLYHAEDYGLVRYLGEKPIEFTLKDKECLEEAFPHLSFEWFYYLNPEMYVCFEAINTFLAGTSINHNWNHEELERVEKVLGIRKGKKS